MPTPSEGKGAEVYVGLFLLIGFAFIAVMVVKFGRVGQGLAKYYEVTVEFPNASGLIKGADVLLAGARIGHAADAPFLLVADGYSVGVKLKIREDVKIPRTARFVVNQAGLLGDVYIDVIPPAKLDPGNVVQPGEMISGTHKPGLEDLQQQGGLVLEKLVSELDEIKTLTENLNKELLSKKNIQTLTETFENLKATSGNLSDASKRLDPIFTKADTAVESAKSTMKHTDQAAAQLEKAIADFRKVADTADTTLKSARTMVDTGTRVLQKADRGDGALGMLLSDRETAENLRALITNMRRSGPVFYKNREAERSPPKATPRPR
jgi:phospholipid/cholesterol/gamma-HCH transport system substrate-binding protein